MTGVAIHHPEHDRMLADDGRVAVRTMTDDERRRFAAEAPGLMREGMTAAGVLTGPDAPITRLDDRLAALADAPPPDELLLTATVDDVAAGRFWATLVPGDDGVDLLGNYLDLFPEFRGQGLTRSFMAAIEGWVIANDVRDISVLLYGHARTPAVDGPRRRRDPRRHPSAQGPRVARRRNANRARGSAYAPGAPRSMPVSRGCDAHREGTTSCRASCLAAASPSPP